MPINTPSVINVVINPNLKFASGSIIGASNIGEGEGILFTSVSQSLLPFKTIKAGTNIIITNNANDVTISSSGSTIWGAITGSINNQNDLQNQFLLKEDLTNKSTSTLLGTSNTLYPTQNAVKVYVDTNILASGSTNTFQNIGTGEGEVYESSSASIVSLRTIKAGAYTEIINNTNDITINGSGVVPYTGSVRNVDLGSYGSIQEFIQFNTLPSVSVVTGKTYWDSSDNTLSTILDSVNGVILQHGQENHVRVVNKTGSPLLNGQVVYVSGVQGNRPTVSLALANNISTSTILGVCTQNIDINLEGFVTTQGIVRGVNTSEFTEGDILYVDEIIPGKLTNTIPSGSSYLVFVGCALNSTIDGLIFIHPRSRIALDSTLALNSDLVVPSQKAVKSYVDSGLFTKVTANSIISSGSFTKVTVDSKGLVTSGSVATTADINDSLDRRYVTDANLVIIGNTSNTNTGDETQTTIKQKLGSASVSQDGYLTKEDFQVFQSSSLTTASNLGLGEIIYSGSVGNDLQFKTLVAGTNVTLSSNGNEVTINASGTASGSIQWQSVNGYSYPTNLPRFRIYNDRVDADLLINKLPTGTGTDNWVTAEFALQNQGTGGTMWTLFSLLDDPSTVGSGTAIFAKTKMRSGAIWDTAVHGEIFRQSAGTGIVGNFEMNNHNASSDAAYGVVINYSANAEIESTFYRANAALYITGPGATNDQKWNYGIRLNATSLYGAAILFPIQSSIGTSENGEFWFDGSDFNFRAGGVLYKVSKTGVTSSGSATWGQITGSIINQTDLINLFNASGSFPSNIGGGEGIFAQKVGVDSQFKTLVAGDNVVITSDADSITISSTGTGSLVSGSVLLQSTTPGTQQIGHINVSGDIFASSSINIGTQQKDATAILNIVGSGTNTNSIIKAEVDGVTRTTITGLGFQSWYLNSGTSEVGSIVYGTPSGTPGITYYNTAGTGRSGFRQLASGGGLAFGATAGSGQPSNQFVVTTAGSVSIGVATPAWKLDVAAGWINSVSGYKTNGADYGEYFESIDGNKIPFGISVILIKDKIRPAKNEETPFGVISATCSWIGDNGGSEWPGKYLRNDIGEFIYEEVTEVKTRQKVKKALTKIHQVEYVNGKHIQQIKEIEKEEPIFVDHPLYNTKGEIIGTYPEPLMEEYSETIISEKINPEYNSKLAYIKREERLEWHVVGLLGKVRLLKNQPVAPSWIKLKDISENVELWLIK